MRESISNWKSDINKFQENTKNKSALKEETEVATFNIKCKQSNNQKNKKIDYMGLLDDISKDDYPIKQGKICQSKVNDAKPNQNKNNKVNKNKEVRNNIRKEENKTDF